MAISLKDRLKSMISAAEAPLLTDPEIDDLLLRARRADSAGNPAIAAWQPGHPYQLGTQVTPNAWNGHIYECTQAGVSDPTTEPTFPTGPGATVADDTVVWTEAGADPWNPTYNLNAAAAEGWRWKAGKASPNYSFGIDGEHSAQSDVFDHCMTMAEKYSGGESGSARVTGMIDDDAFLPLDQRAFGPTRIIP